MVLTKLKIIVKGPTGGGKSTVIDIIREALSSHNIQFKKTEEHELTAIIKRPTFLKEEGEKDGQ